MKDVNPDPNGVNQAPGYANGAWEFYFYGVTGQKLMTAMISYSPAGSGNLYWSPLSYNNKYYYYFGKKLIVANGSYVVTDRLGSVRASSAYGGGAPWTQMSYFPYGEERTSTPDGTEKFGTYYRDGVGQDYAEQRYYNNGTGRFWSVDPGGIKTASPSTPTSWNRYAYTNGDPVNYIDRHGLIAQVPICLNEDPDSCVDDGDGGGCWGDGLGFLGMPDPGCPSGGGGDQQPPTPTCAGTLGDSGACYINLHKTGADWSSFSANVTKLYAALAKDPKCEDWLESTVGVAGLQSLLETPIPAEYALASSITPPPGFSGIISASYGDLPSTAPSSAPIAVNWSVYSQQTSLTTKFGILLHEIAHALDPTGYNQNDGNSQGLENANDSLVAQHCAKTLRAH
jgi:RHS repeat-associated protein